MTSITTLPADSALPQLADALDVGHMQQVFSHYLNCAHERSQAAMAPVSVGNCSIRRIKYKPGAKCLVWYDLEILNPAHGDVRHQWYVTRMYPPNGSLSRYQKALDTAQVRPAVGPALMHLSSMDMVAWSFPNERKLHGLPGMMNRGALIGRVLPEVVHAGLGHDWRIVHAEPSIASYAPEYTCSVRVDLTLRHRRTQALRPWPIYGKTYYDNRGASTHKSMLELHAAVSRARSALVVPRALVYQPDSHTLWQEAVAGRPLFDGPQPSQVCTGALDGAARALAALHDTGVQCSQRLDAEQLAARLPALPALLRRLSHEGAGMADAVVKLLASQVDELRRDDCATLHGDLHAKNILIADSTNGSPAPDSVALIDLDTLASGPPAHDLGSWVAALLNRAVVLGLDLDSAFDMARGFVAAYRAHAVLGVADADIRWHTAAALINERAVRTLTRLKPGRLAHVAPVIRLAGEVASLRTGWLP